MTPEERATEIVDSLARHRAGRDYDAAFRKEIEASIRIAENDAMERAAQLVDVLYEAGPGTSPAIRIRALKHKAVA